jgi:DNA-binding MarR family transcriptional regulator
MASPPLSRRQQELLDIVRDMMSATSTSIAEVFGVTQYQTVYTLRILRKRGLVVCSRNGKGGRWSTPEDAALSEAAHEHSYALELASERARKRLAQRKAREQQREARERAFECWSTTVTRRVVSAASCPPIRPRAPASVFNLAQCAA